MQCFCCFLYTFFFSVEGILDGWVKKGGNFFFKSYDNGKLNMHTATQAKETAVMAKGAC